MEFYQRSPKNNLWIQNKGCALLSTLKQIYKMLGLDSRINLTPNQWEMIFMNNDILRYGIMQWPNLEKLFPVKIDPYIYNRDIKHHFDPDIIKPNAVFSVDGQKRVGYQSHFLALDGKGENTLFAYDPWENCVVDIMEIYNKGSLKQSVFTIVNMKKE